MTRLGRELQARNHDVVFLYSSNASGLPCVPGPEKDHIHENRGQTSKLQGEHCLAQAQRPEMLVGFAASPDSPVRTPGLFLDC